MKIFNRIYNRINRDIERLVVCVGTSFFRLRCCVQGIGLGRGIKVFGLPYTKVGNGGSIIIGNDCVFRSKTTSNLMGLNHPCILAATPAYKDTTAILTIGNNCGFSGVSIWCAKEIRIGNNVRVGANTLIMDGDAHYDDLRTPPPQSIDIQDDVFVGANCVIKKGVIIGQGSMIGMNSVVTHDVPAYAVAVGCPAKVIRFLNK